MQVRREGVATALWAAAAAATALALIYTVSFLSFGVLAAVPLFIWLERHASIGRAIHGVLLGGAVLPAWVAWYHRDYQECPPSAADVADGAWQCGGTDPRPFAIAAVLLVLGFLVVWYFARPRGRLSPQ